MKKLIALLTAASAVFGLNTASAQETAVSYEIGAKYITEYVFRGQEVADDAAVTTLKANIGDFTAGTALILPTDNDVQGGKEYDFNLGYGVDLNEMVSADVGYTLYYYPNQSAGILDDPLQEHTSELSLALGFDIQLSPKVCVFYDLDLETLGVQLDVGYSLELASVENTTLDFAAYVGIADVDDSQGEAASWAYGGVSATLNHAISENGNVGLGVSYDASDEDEEDENIVGHVSVSAAF